MTGIETHGRIDGRTPGDENLPFPQLDPDALYHDGLISHAERRQLLHLAPNKLTAILADEFVSKLSCLRTGLGHTLDLRGFVHSPPTALRKRFKQLEYVLKPRLGAYTTVLLSTALDSLTHAIPVCIPTRLIPKRDWPRAQFARVTGTVEELELPPKPRYIAATDLHLVGHEAIFRTIDPAITFDDVHDMFSARFAFDHRELTEAALFYLFSSPMYEGRAGGNCLAPIGYSLNEYQCDLPQVRRLVAAVHAVLPPWLRQKRWRVSYEYDIPHRATLSFPRFALAYRPRTPLKKIGDWLVAREPGPRSREPTATVRERNLALAPFHLPRSAVLGSTEQPETAALSFADLPFLLTGREGGFTPSATELLEYRTDLGQLITIAQLELTRTVVPVADRERGVEVVMRWVERDWPELHQLMQWGEVFDPGLIGGLGEHITRLTHAIARATGQSTATALDRSEALIFELYSRFRENLDGYTRQRVADLEEQRHASQTALREQLGTTVESVLLDLEVKHPDGWAQAEFETALATRVELTTRAVEKLFDTLRNEGEVAECAPATYRRVTGFDRIWPPKRR